MRFFSWLIRLSVAVSDVFEESIISKERFGEELKREGVRKRFRRLFAYLFAVAMIWQLSRFIPSSENFYSTREAVSGFLIGNIFGLLLYIGRDRNTFLSWKDFEYQDKALLVGIAMFGFFMPGVLLSGHLGVAATAGGVTAYTVTLPFFYESWRAARLDEINHVRIEKEVEKQICHKMYASCLNFESED